MARQPFMLYLLRNINLTYMTNLQTPNKKAALAVIDELRKSKVLSDKEFRKVFCKSRGVEPDYFTSWNNYARPVKALVERDLMTVTNVNGFIVYALTQKAFRTKNITL